MSGTAPLPAASAALNNDDAQQFAVAAARIASENRAEDVVVLDLRGLSTLADFFVIGTGTSDRQMRAVLDHIADFGRQSGRKPYRVADSRSASWILADFVDVVVHVLSPEHREYYDLDGLWGDAPRVAWGNAEVRTQNEER